MLCYGVCPLVFVIVNLLVLIDGQGWSGTKSNVTKKAYIPIEEYTGKYYKDILKDELTFQHKHVLVKRAVKRKNKGDVEVTKKRPPRTTRVKSKYIMYCFFS